MFAQILRPMRRDSGFTLIELMLVVALIGILSALAIPQFRMYQWRSKRSEAMSNLASIRSVQLAYTTEFGRYVQAVPSPGLSNYPSSTKQNWHKANGGRFYAGSVGFGFEEVGWRPEGGTFFDYDTYTDPPNVLPPNGPRYTAAAYGDVDGDGLLSVFLISVPDAAGNTVDCGFCGGFAALIPFSGPPLNNQGNPVYNTVTQLVPPDADDF